jgi:hypothetical protein
VLEVVIRVDVVVVLVVGGLVVGGLVVGGLVVGPPGVVVPLLDGFPGRPGIPRHAPKLLWQPAPQNSSEEPHQKNWEQQGPKLGLPMHMVLLPHMPLVVTWRSPVGTGVVDVEVTGGLTEVELVVDVDVGGRWVVLVLVGGTGVVEVEVGATLGHPQVPYCVWQSKSGWQWSTESPQKP